MPNLKHCLSVSRLIMASALRRHALKGLLALAITAELGGLFFFDFIPRDIGRASADFIVSTGWITGIIFLFFHCVNVLAWSEERRVIYTLLSRPISREEYVIGIFAGLSGILLLLNTILACFGYATLLLIKGTVQAGYFLHLSPQAYALSWFGLFAAELIILAALTLFSGLVRGGFPVLLMGIAFYGISYGLPVVRTVAAQMVNSKLMHEAVPAILYLLAALFPDLDHLDFKNFIAIAKNPELTSVLLPFAVAVTYTTVVLLAACLVYRKRDII